MLNLLPPHLVYVHPMSHHKGSLALLDSLQGKYCLGDAPMEIT